MKKLLINIICSLSFLSCQFDSDNIHFVEIEKPEQTAVIGIDLAGVTPEGTIYLYTGTKLYYSLYTSGKDLLDISFNLDGETVNSQGGYFLLDPANLSEGDHPLSVDIKVKTGSGSVAELLGAEYYQGKYAFTVKVVKNADLALTISHKKNTEGYLELNWDNPNLDKLNVDYYIIHFEDAYSGGRQSIRISNPGQRSYIDKSFVYGARVYDIETVFKNNSIDPWVTQYSVNSAEITEKDVFFESITSEKTKVTWKANEYKCKCILKTPDNEVIFVPDGQSYAEIATPAFPAGNGYYSLYILPDYTLNEEYIRLYPSVYIYKNSYPLLSEYGASSFAYDIRKKLLYTTSGYYIISYDATTMRELTQLKTASDNTFTQISCSSITSKMAVNIGSDIYIYKDNTFENPVYFFGKAIPYNSSYNIFYLTDNDLIVAGMSSTNDGYVDVYKATNGNWLYTIPLKEYYSKVTISPDGKYLCDYGSQKYWIYELGAKEAKEIHHAENKYLVFNNCFFNPTKPHQLVMTGYDRLYTIDVPSFNESEMKALSYVCNDPFTGNFIFSDKNYSDNRMMNIMSPDMKTTLLKVKTNYPYIKLYNNFMVSTFYSPSYYYDLTNYLK